MYLAIAACAAGQGATTALNAANEVAVGAFIDGQIRFTDICRVNEKCLAHFLNYATCSLDDIVALDFEARAYAQQLLRTLN